MRENPRHKNGAKHATLSAREETLANYKDHVNRGFASFASVMGLPIGVRSEGAIVYDEQDTPYLDCGGYGVFLHGHCHPRVVDAVRVQLERNPLATHGTVNAELAAAAATLARVTPPDLEYITFTNSGAEAVELGLKLARLNGRRRLITMLGGFHGKTLGALSVNGKSLYKDPFVPLLPDVTVIPFGDAHALEVALDASEEAACVIVEPVQGEGGVNIPPDGYLSQLQQLCRTKGAFLILDEVQSGLGRLGAWWGANREDIRPDVMLVGKALSGGVVPVGAVAATNEAYEALNRDPFLHSSTFGGNPLATAAARAAIETIEDEHLVERSAALGETLLSDLRSLLQKNCAELLADVRGQGLLLGIEFNSEPYAGDFVLRLLQERVIVSHSLNAHRVVRLTPPAILTTAHCAWLFSAVASAANALRRAW